METYALLVSSDLEDFFYDAYRQLVQKNIRKIPGEKTTHFCTYISPRKAV